MLSAEALPKLRGYLLLQVFFVAASTEVVWSNRSCQIAQTVFVDSAKQAF